MKKCFFLVAMLMCVLTTSSNAQKDSSGVYMSAADYASGTLQYAINCKTQSHKIQKDILFKKKKIVVKHEGKTYKLNMGAVYAVRYCNGSIVRLFMGKRYPMLNVGEHILLYKVMTGPMGKSPATTTYYFSRDADSPVQILTMNSLNMAFPDNHTFHDLVEAEFHNESDLTKYDDTHKMYRINRLYLNSLGKK